MTERPGKLELSNFPDDLRWRFKSLAAKNGRTMSEVGIQLIAAYCDEQEAAERKEAAGAGH